MDLVYGAAGSGQTPGAGVEISRREEEGTCGSLVSVEDDRGKVALHGTKYSLQLVTTRTRSSLLEKSIFQRVYIPF